MSNIIVIGNGFDLHCGLDSRYSDFLKDRKETLDTVLDFIYELVPNGNSHDLSDAARVIDNILKRTNYQITFWDMYFLLKDYQLKKSLENWFDVEKLILGVVKPRRGMDYSDLCIDNITGALNTMVIERNNQVTINNTNFGYYNSILAYFIYAKNLEGSRYRLQGIDRNQMYQIVFEELKSFEAIFLEYLKKIQTGISYYKKAQTLLKQMNIGSKEFSLLNFNYTDPTLFIRDEMKNLLKAKENVHGSINKNSIIFGIDQGTIEGDDVSYQFTKTSRKMFELDNKKIEENHHFLKRDVENIIFYGHSLGNADYSYYLSIFDFYDIYSSDVSLVFYYSVYDTSKKSEISKEFRNKVIRLILEYGTTLDNKDHGKNLLHRLLLEKRLFIIKLLDRHRVDKNDSSEDAFENTY